MRPTPGVNDVDFNHYYVAGFVVRHGLWNYLYPVPNPDVYEQPNHFAPKYRTFLFNPTTAHKDISFYPVLSDSSASHYSAELIKLLPEAVNWRYIEPPPAALLFWPLSFFSFDHAARYVWPTLCSWSLFLAAWLAARIHRLLKGGDSYTEAIIFIACTIFSFRGITGLDTGNNTPVLSALIALTVYALLRMSLGVFVCAYLPLLLLKPIGVMWLPCLVLNRAYWRVIFYLAVGSVMLNGIVYELAGISVYEKFLSLAPMIIIPIGMGLVPFVRDFFGFYPHTFYLFIKLAVLGVLYYGYWKNGLGNTRSENERALCLLALFAGTIALFCLFNFIIWFHYAPNYLFFPFLGWILQEGYLAKSSWRRVILGGTFLTFLVLISQWFIKGGIFHLFGAKACARYLYDFYGPYTTILLPAGFLVLAVHRLIFCPPVTQTNPTTAAN